MLFRSSKIGTAAVGTETIVAVLVSPDVAVDVVNSVGSVVKVVVAGSKVARIVSVRVKARVLNSRSSGVSQSSSRKTASEGGGFYM